MVPIWKSQVYIESSNQDDDDEEAADGQPVGDDGEGWLQRCGCTFQW